MEIVAQFQQSIEDGDKKNKTLEEVIEKNNKAYEQLEKEHSEIVTELQQWIEDGDLKNKDLEEVIEKMNEENVQLLIQVSVAKKEMKVLETKNKALESELATKRTDVKRFREKEYYSERELRNLKRDLKKKQHNVEDAKEKLHKAMMAKQELLDDVYHLQSCLVDCQKNNETLNATITDLREMVKELNESNDYGKSSLIDQLEVQLDIFMSETGRIINEKDRELNEVKAEASSVKAQLETQIAKYEEVQCKISEKDRELIRLKKVTLPVTEQLEGQLPKYTNEKTCKVFTELKKDGSMLCIVFLHVF